MKMDGKILICSAEEGTRESLKQILADTYDMILCEDVEQCLEIAKRVSIRVVILNSTLQNNVKEILNQLATLKPSIKTYLIRGYKEKSQQQEISSPLIAGYITKPFKPEEVLSICK